MHFQKPLHSLVLLLCLIPFISNAQTPTKTIAEAQSTYAIYLGKTSPVKDLIPLGPTSKEKKIQWKKQNKVPRNFVGRGHSKVVKPELEHQGKDQLRQGILAGTKMTDANILVNVDGNTNGTPNDPTGDIGKDHYVQAINATSIGIYDKSGAEIATFTANTLWQEIGFSSAGDPIVMYDQEEDRWVITEFPNGNQLLVAISENSDPTGAYDVYNFQTPSFPDYPKYGIWKDAITVTTNEQGAGNLTVYMINKAQLYGGKPEVDIQRLNLPGNTETEAGFFVATPVDWMGKNTPVSEDPIFLALDDSSWGTAAQDQVNVFTVDVDWLEPANTSYTTLPIITSPFDGNPCSAGGFGFACVPQAGNGGGLDAIPEVIMNQAIYRNFGDHEAMVFNFITDVTDGENLSGIRWMELRRTVGTEWTLYQEGTFSPDDGLDRYMGGIAFDASGNIGLAYNVSSEEMFVGVRFTGRKYDDVLGEMTVPEQVLAEGDHTLNSFGRFGDYAQMGVDPVNGKTFWYTTEYAGGNGSSSATRIVAFELDRDNIDIGVHKLVSSSTAAFDVDELITVQINNYGLEDVTGFNVGFIFENGTVIEESVSETIPAGGQIEYTFVETVDFIGGGFFDLVTFTNLANDELVVNDTMYSQLQKLVALDAGPGGISLPLVSCSDDVDGTFQIFNFGNDEITTLNYDILINGVLYESVAWVGNLAFCETDEIVFSLLDLPAGDHVISIELSLPNGEADQNMANDISATSISIIANGILTTLTIDTDQYPNETTWELADDSGNIIYSGGPYQQGNSAFSHEFCLVEDACYVFTIFDSYGDGLENIGAYVIVSELGQTFASIMQQNFGEIEISEFCADGSCIVEVNSTVTPADVDGGTILLIPTSGVGPFMYSIDGGTTFQDNGLFENVPAGTYDIIIQGIEACTYEGQIVVESCSLEVMFEVDPDTDVAEGAILINVTNGNGPYQYSIDGGNTFQNNSLFTNLVFGSYEIVVKDADGCTFEITIEVTFMIGTQETHIGSNLKITPNPTPGVFQIHLEGVYSGETFVKFSIYNAVGQAIRHSTLVRYDNIYTTSVSLYHEPAGIYYVRVYDAGINKMIRVVKI